MTVMVHTAHAASLYEPLRLTLNNFPTYRDTPHCALLPMRPRVLERRSGPHTGVVAGLRYRVVQRPGSHKCRSNAPRGRICRAHNGVAAYAQVGACCGPGPSHRRRTAAAEAHHDVETRGRVVAVPGHAPPSLRLRGVGRASQGGHDRGRYALLTLPQ